jgi:hypothetical protein
VHAWRSEDGNWVWSFVLRDTGAGTRLISRNCFRLPRLIDRIGMVPMEMAWLVMERKMLLGVKERAERLAAHRTAVAVAEAVFRPGANPGSVPMDDQTYGCTMRSA